MKFIQGWVQLGNATKYTIYKWSIQEITFNLKFTAKRNYYPGNDGRFLENKEINILKC